MRQQWLNEIVAWVNGAVIQSSSIEQDDWEDHPLQAEIPWDSTILKFRVKEKDHDS